MLMLHVLFQNDLFGQNTNIAIDQGINKALKASVFSFFKSETKGKSSIKVRKFEGYNFESLDYQLSLVSGSFFVDGNGRSIVDEGSQIIVKFSSPRHLKNDQIIVEGVADGKGGFLSIDTIDYMEGVIIETTAGKKYVYKKKHWKQI